MPNRTWLARIITIGVATSGSSLVAAEEPDDCLPPSEPQCYENPLAPESYFATACGADELFALATTTDSACGQIIASRADAERAAIASEGLVSVPAGMSPDPGRDYICEAAILDYEPALDPVMVDGLSTSYAGASQRFKSESIGGTLQELMLSPVLERQRWDVNGNGVETCEEFVYERYYDYSLWEDFTATRGDDFRAMYDEGVARLGDGVNSKAGAFVASVPTSPDRAPKNVFFTYRQDYPLPAYGRGHYTPQKYAFHDATLVARLDRGKGVYEHSLAWHQYMNAALAGHDDRELYALAQKQREFITLLEQRAAVYRRWTHYAQAMRAANGSCDQTFTPYSMGALDRRARIWDPADRVAGIGLAQIYDRSAYDGLAVRTPLELRGFVDAPNDTGLISSRALAYSASIVRTQDLLAVYAADPLAQLAQARQLTTPPEEIVGTEPLGDPAEGEVAPPGPRQCPAYTAPDGLPSVGDDLSCAGLILLASCADGARYQVTEKLRELDARIEKAFDDIAPYGCLELADGVDSTQAINPFTGKVAGVSASACDWNPEVFVRDVSNHFTAERERDFRLCMESTGGIFTPSHPIHHALEGLGDDPDPIATAERAARHGVPLQDDYTDSTELVLGFIEMAREWSTAVDFQRDPRTGKPIAGHSASDGDRLGNSLFGVDYGYAAEWKLDGLPATAEAWGDGVACEVGLYAQASATASGTVFGMTVDLLDAYARVESVQEGAQRRGRRDLRFEVLGVDILGPAIDGSASSTTGAGDAPIEFHVARERTESEEVASMTFVVAGVPITVRAGVAGRVGVAFDARIDLRSDCPTMQTSVTGGLTPSAQLDAFVSGGVNLAIAEVGLQIDLTLLRLALPFELALQLAPSADGVPMIYARPKLSLELTSLSGRLRAFLKFPVGKPLYATLFSWRGVELDSTELFAPNWRYPLARVGLGLQVGGAN